MTETGPLAVQQADGLRVLRGLVLLAVLGGFFCSAFSVRTLLNYPSILPNWTIFPVHFGAFAVIGSSVLILRAQAILDGFAVLEWLWAFVPKRSVPLVVLAALLSWQVAERMPGYPRGSPEARVGLGPSAEDFIGACTVFYVVGAAILIGALRAARRS